MYGYDDTTGGNKGKGRRTGMADAATAEIYQYSYIYDSWGRLTGEALDIADDDTYTTSYAYDGAGRITTITYPTGEEVTQTYNGRGLPYGLSTDAPVTLVSGTLYNQLGSMTQIDLGNGLRNTFGYYSTGGTYDTTGGYYGQLWEIRTLPQVGGTALLDLKYTWDAGGNLATRQDVPASETETFSYDQLDRLTAAGGPYSESYAYNEIGNMTSKNGVSHTDGSAGPHAVTGVGGTYTNVYDANGSMTTRANATGTQTLTFDVENRLSQVQGTGGGYSGTTTYVYNGDGKRIRKTEGGSTIDYVNRFFEMNVTSGVETSHYYLGDRQVGIRSGSSLEFIHGDHLGSTSASTSGSTGALVSRLSYYPYGTTRSTVGTLGTDQKFTGQRLDGNDLYFYNARYYDAGLGRFISADTLVSRPADPQSYNRYSYVLNNPLRYVDPSGERVVFPTLGPDPAKLQQAWSIFKAAAPTQANAMEDNFWQTYQIGWHALGGQGSLTLDFLFVHTISIDRNLLGGDPVQIALHIAHESFHALEGSITDTVLEEVMAYQFESQVGQRLRALDFSVHPDATRFADRFNQFDLSMTGPALDIELERARDTLREAGGAAGFIYSNIALRPPTFREMLLDLGKHLATGPHIA